MLLVVRLVSLIERVGFPAVLPEHCSVAVSRRRLGGVHALLNAHLQLRRKLQEITPFGRQEDERPLPDKRRIGDIFDQ